MSYPLGENETARVWQLNNNEYKRVLRTERSVIKGGTTEPIETNTLYFKQFGAAANSVYLQRAERRKGSQLLEQTQYDHYNAYGNPQQVQQQQRAPTVYLWGYGGQYPVARIEHATFAQVQSALGGGTAATAALNGLLSPTVTDGFIQSTLETVRTQLTASRVSAFHYRPLVGISGMTGARGLAEYYHYDGLGRLKLMLDFQQYVRYRYDYHFKP
ncbi:MAG TPA: hypothetical protein VFD72_04670 [Sphingobacteriaceae bacterium]|nr:hypothetical protein [Sphingobacteriaceae bacterium]